MRPVNRFRSAAVSASIIFLLFVAAQRDSAYGSTLYLTYLRPERSVVSPASGAAMLKLSDDETSVIISFQYSNLTSPITAIHIHGPADPGDTGPILFDLD